MKLLMLTRYGRHGASSRMRAYQYLPWLASAGIDVTLSPLFSDAYIAGLQQGRRSLREAVVAYSHRLQALLRTRLFDLLWIEKEALPWLPTWLENVLLPKGIPYVLDYDDAVFHHYDLNSNPLIRRLFAWKHPTLMRGAALVVTGNEYLADFARRAGARYIDIVPTVIDLERYPAPGQKQVKDKLAPPCIGWIGQRATAPFLAPYAALFQQLASAGQARFAAIGIDALSLGLPLESIPWTEQTEVASIASFDIGIMPLEDEPFERGKCGYKLIQYMACGLPVVASPVGVNREIVEQGVNGLLAETPRQWEDALVTLSANPDLRQRMGLAGRQKVEKLFCIQVTGPLLTTLLRGAAEVSSSGN